MNSELKNILNKAKLAGNKYALNIRGSRFSSLNGEKYGSGSGSSLEFMDHREYFPGDDIRHIDWGAVAKYDRPIVKVFKKDAAPLVEIIVDCSASMSLPESKKFYALWGLAELIGSASKNSGCFVATKTIKASCENLSAQEYEKCNENEFLCDYRGDTGKTFVSFAPKFKPRSIRFLLSDLFWNVEPASILNVLCNNASIVNVIQVVSSKDEKPDLFGNYKLVDVETNEYSELMVDKSILEQYEKNYNKHRDNWKNACSSVGCSFAHVVSEEFIADFKPEGLLEKLIFLPGGYS